MTRIDIYVNKTSLFISSLLFSYMKMCGLLIDSHFRDLQGQGSVAGKG